MPVDDELLVPEPGGVAAPRTLSDLAYITLRDAIITSRLEPGLHLRQEDLAQRFGMSVIPIREALRRLESAGLVEIPPHRGATVVALSKAEFAEVCELRLDLEIPAIRRAAQRFDEVDADLAVEELALWRAAIVERQASAAAQAHQRFHLRLYRAHYSTWLSRQLVPLWETYSRYWYALRSREDWSDRSWEGDAGHQLLLDRCRAHDAKGAAETMRRHLQASFDLLGGALEEWSAATSRDAGGGSA